MADKVVKVVDRNGNQIVEFQKIPNDVSIEEFKKILVKECATLSINCSLIFHRKERIVPPQSQINAR